MRTIVVLLIAALVLTPALAHAAGGYGGSGGGPGLVGVVFLPVLVILLLARLGDNEQVAAAATSVVPPADGSDR